MANLGSLFRARREERGWTLDDIAARTKIPLRLLVELEGNTFTHWPASRIYRIGYLRAYAKAVGLDAAQVIAQYDADTTRNDPGLPAADHGRRTAPPRKRPSVSPSLALACALIGALLIGLPLYVGPERPVAAQAPSEPPRPADIALEPAPAETTAVSTSGGVIESDDVEGELVVESSPAGTRVVVNGIARGTTPLRLRYLPAGPYTIRLVRDGYESQEASTTITSEQPVRSLSITLRQR
jgi:transcriptional regulator with XRE-family HTH domain